MKNKKIMTDKLHHLAIGKVFHHRNSPKEHKFSMPIYMLLIQLNRSDLPKLKLLSKFMPSDYWDKTAKNASQLEQKIIDAWYERGLTINRVELLTNPRTLAIEMNPISIFYCYEDHQLKAILVEVTNTPWKERQHYFLCIEKNKDIQADGFSESNMGSLSFTFNKTMHVSPFNPMNLVYKMNFIQSDNQRNVFMSLFKKNHQLFSASLTLELEQLTKNKWRDLFFKKPVITLQIATKIYWEALKLAIKKVPFYKHPNKNSL